MDAENLTEGRYDEKDRDEGALRPETLETFIGQDSLKENLSVFLQAARERKEPLDHVFLSGPPGLGKTTLAMILAREMGTELRITAAPALEKPKDLAGLLTSLTEGAVFFIDEIHRLKPALEEMLYVAMEDRELDWIIGQGPSARTIRIPLVPFTLVGATTRPGSVSSPLYSRFGISFRLSFYTQRDMIDIINRSSRLLGVSVSAEGCELLALSSRGTPRVCNRLLRRIRDYAQIKKESEISFHTVETALKSLEIDFLGLERHDRRLLEILIDQFQGGPVGGETLAIAMNESVDTLEDFFEPYLIQQGLLQRTPRGRIACEKAYRHLGRPYTNETQSTLF